MLSVAVHNHYKRIPHEAAESKDAPHAGVEIEKTNIMLIGSTGIGKTLLARTLPTCLSPLPTPPARPRPVMWVRTWKTLSCVYYSLDHDVKRAEMGIIYIDEIDKITRRTENVSSHAMFPVKATAGAAQDSGRHHLRRTASGRSQASPAGIHPRQHPQHPVHLRRRFCDLDKVIQRRVGNHVLLRRAGTTGLRHARGREALKHVEPEDWLQPRFSPNSWPPADDHRTGGTHQIISLPSLPTPRTPQPNSTRNYSGRGRGIGVHQGRPAGTRRPGHCQVLVAPCAVSWSG